jgi:hypothetical protein
MMDTTRFVLQILKTRRCELAHDDTAVTRLMSHVSRPDFHAYIDGGIVLSPSLSLVLELVDVIKYHLLGLFKEFSLKNT